MANAQGLIRANLKVLFLAACMAAIPAAAPAQPRASRVEIRLERKESGVWKAVEPSLILSSGDVIRFRFKSSFDGFLYVTDYGTSGNYTLLFPRAETGQKNQVEKGKEYLIPATESIFRVAGPPGYEAVYWLVSPVVLGNPLDLTPAQLKSPPLPMSPRCDDTILRARGVCLDALAGPKNIGEDEKLPEELNSVKGATARELTIVQQGNQSVLSAGGPAAAPLLYEFRIAHK